ncbi:2-hydroxyacid dehydrogenase [[Mycobacterium] fortunisiensis]|uniref:2-hydroxyacid dehydrogenase n=1 Tax=[Mycobacterium] fortunisiensis TaxID=2600579 RepID=UPI0027DF7A04|nr:2-hydroxyacid dehydrogenase [[Mycobacterium] fortunisiensis]
MPHPVLKVLVPDDLGVKILDSAPGLDAVRYQAGEPWPVTHRDAPVVVVGPGGAGRVGTRLAELPELRLVQTLSAGYEQWVPHLPDGVALANARGAHGGSSAEWVVAVLLTIYRDLWRFKDLQSQGIWSAKETDTLIGKRVLILGAGDLAVNLAARLAPFEVDVTLVGRHARAGVHAMSEIEDLLPSADAVVAMLPADESTYHIIDSGFLAQLRDGTVVVNVGRGPAVDPDALLAELSSGRLRAALDVTEPEPLPAGHPLWSAPGLLLTPHVAGSTSGASERAWQVARDQITAYAAGQRPPNLVVEPERGT